VATMDDLDKLPPDLVWQQDGHLSDIVLSSIADGEVNIVPLEAHSHLEHCDHCTTRFGAEALLSMHAGELLAEVSRVAEMPAVVMPRSVRDVAVDGLAKLPKRAFFGALFLAAMGALPALLSQGHWRFAHLHDFGSSCVVLFGRGGGLIAEGGSFTVLMWASALTLLALGLVVSRLEQRTVHRSLL